MIKLFTHTDLDGVGCAILSKLAFGDEVDIEYCNYNDVDEKVVNFINAVKNSDTNIGQVFITDISVNEETAKMLDGINHIPYSIHLFDHHKTANHLNKYPWCIVRETLVNPDIKTCGTELFFIHLVGYRKLHNTKTIDDFIGAVGAYDTWLWKDLPKTSGQVVKEFNDLLYILGRDEFIERCMKRFKGNKSLLRVTKDERLLLDIRQKEIDAYIDKKDKELVNILLNGDDVGVVFADRFVSELGNTLAERHRESRYIVIIDPGAGKVSYRTVRDDTDVGAVAKLYGGGGHPKAAGHMFDDDKKVCMMFHVMNPRAFELEAIEIESEEFIPDEKPQPKKSWWDRVRGK